MKGTDFHFSRQDLRPNIARHASFGYDLILQAYLTTLITDFLDSVTRSPLYSIYGETIAGVPVIRAFGASSKFLRDMLRCVDTVSRLLSLFNVKTITRI